MVLLPLQFAASGWDLLRGAASTEDALRHAVAPSTAAAGAGPVLVFAAAGDVDALATVRVLTALLKADLTRYEVHPVAGYRHLREKYRVLARGDAAVDPRAVLCVNCGAAVDLERVLGITDADHAKGEDTDVRIFVMDCHRPYHLKNIKSARIVMFHDDDKFNQEALPLDVGWEDQWGNVADDSSSSEEESESDDESEEDDFSDDDVAESLHLDDDELEEDDHPDQDDIDSDPTEGKNRNAIASPTHSSLSSAAVDASADFSLPSRKRKRKRRIRDKDLEAIQEDDVRFDDEGSTPSSEDDEEASADIKKSRNRHRAEKKTKRAHGKRKRRRHFGPDPEAEERERLKRYYSNSTVASSSALLSHTIASILKRANIDTLWMAILGATSHFMSFLIAENLYEDAFSYFQQQIGIITPNTEEQDGNTSRQQAIGYAQSCQSSDVQRIVPNTELRLDLLRHWSLHDSLIYSSYTATRLASWRQTGRRRLQEMLATLGIPLKDSQENWCYMNHKHKKALEDNLHKAITRFDLGDSLQYDSFVRSMPGHKGEISAADFSLAIAALLEIDDPSQLDRQGDPSKSLVDRFWRAYDALDCNRAADIESGLEMAISVQRLTADIAGDVIERRKYVPSGSFRYLFLREHHYRKHLAHPLLLRRLALFLSKALVRQGSKDKPCVILAQDEVRGVWIAVAATTPGQTNDFGHRFRNAAERNNSDVTYDGFDSSICEIRDGQEIEFVRFLHDVMG